MGEIKEILRREVLASVIECELRRYINESLGISMDVISACNSLYASIVESMRGCGKTVDENGISTKHDKVTDEFHGMKLLVEYSAYYFKTREEYEEKKGLYSDNFDNARSFFMKGKLAAVIFSFPVISGVIVRSVFNDSLYHEIEHLYQQIRYGECLPKDELYADRVKYYNESMDDITKNISALFYYSYEFEQNGFINGLYGELMSDKYELPVCYFSDIKETDCYKAYERMKESMDFIEGHKDESAVACILHNEFKYNGGVDKFLKQSKQSMDLFLRKIGKVIIQAHVDRVNRDHISESWCFLRDKSRRFLL